MPKPLRLEIRQDAGTTWKYPQPWMISYDEAVALIREHAVALAGEDAPLGQALGRYLSRDLAAKFDSPRFTNSAVDGYAVHAEDLVTRELVLVGETKAGDPAADLQPGQARRVFTGAPVPLSTGAVVMQEDVIIEGQFVKIESLPKAGAHMRVAGEEFRAGDVLIRRGSSVTPAVIGLAAGQGHETLPVHRRPKVAVVVTGSELAEAGSQLRDGQIYESNGAMLGAAFANLGLDAQQVRVTDEAAEIERAFVEALQSSDLVVTSGGVSVGDYDLVRPALHKLGVEEIFWRVAIKPGKPVYFGRRDSTYVLGLPGNPVSALVTFALFGMPLLHLLQGKPAFEPFIFEAELAGDIGEGSGRYEFLRGTLKGRTVEVLEEQGSSMLSGLAKANCLIHVPSDAQEKKRGELVKVTPLPWQHC